MAGRPLHVEVAIGPDVQGWFERNAPASVAGFLRYAPYEGQLWVRAVPVLSESLGRRGDGASGVAAGVAGCRLRLAGQAPTLC